MEWGRNFRSQPQKHWVELYKVDNQACGELVPKGLVESSNLELLNNYTWTVPGRSESVKLTEYRMIMPSIVNKFSPPLYDILVHLLGEKYSLFIYYSQFRSDFFVGLARTIWEVRPADSVINWLLSAVMMGFALWHGWPRRTSWSKFLFWLAFVGIFNLVGLLTYLALNHTTVIKCPACGKSRGLTKVNCIRCGVELPAPKRGKLDLIFNS
jgi:ribosomal protein S27E